jgi:hypothetical protein
MCAPGVDTQVAPYGWGCVTEIPGDPENFEQKQE